MESGKHFTTGVARHTNHVGKHRANRYSDHGIGYIPLGDRTRGFLDHGVDIYEEQDSIDISTSKRRW